MIKTSLLELLNEKQREAVTAPLGNSLVLAGAGSGKTRVLVSRIAWLISEFQLSAYEILAVTFTNKAAEEMRTRLHSLVDIPPREMWVGTFHGLCHRLLRRHYQEAGLPAQFHILDSDDQGRIIKRIINSMNLDITKWPVRQAQGYINSKKDEGLRPHHIKKTTYSTDETLLSIYKTYEQACKSAGVIDFAELLLRTHEILRDNPDLLKHYQQRFKAVLVDEFQDTNTIQYAWIRLLTGPNTSIMAVGDDDQSIYGWRGARVENIHRFEQDYEKTQIIRLEQNYRSTATILDAANALIANNDSRLGKTLWTAGAQGEKIVLYSAFNELDEARFVADRIQMALNDGFNLDEIAILYRSNAQSRVIEEALLRAGILYRIYGGVRFFERAEIKDSLAYLRLLANSNDDTAFERVVNFPTRGIGEKTLEELRNYAKAHQQSMWQAAAALLTTGHFPNRAALALNKFVELIQNLQGKTASLPLEEQLKEVIYNTGLHAYFSKVKGDKSDSKLDNLQELINAGKQFRDEHISDDGTPILVAFLAHASMEAGEMQAAEHERYVHLMTLHAAKGLEFPWVFLVGFEEGLFPSAQSIGEPGRLEEERRLCYVGMTRAMKKLVISYAEVRRQYGREEYHRASRFLKEIPAEFLNSVRVNSKANAATFSQKPAFTAMHESGIKLGQTVSHAKFGMGTVLSIEGNGAHTRVQVQFQESDAKWLVVAYANLLLH